MSFNFELIAVVIYWLPWSRVSYFDCFSFQIHCLNCIVFLFHYRQLIRRLNVIFQHTFSQSLVVSHSICVFFVHFSNSIRLSLLWNSHTFHLNAGDFMLFRIHSSDCSLQHAYLKITLNFNCVTANGIRREKVLNIRDLTIKWIWNIFTVSASFFLLSRSFFFN